MWSLYCALAIQEDCSHVIKVPVKIVDRQYLGKTSDFFGLVVTMLYTI